jgi:hypothetical protein
MKIARVVTPFVVSILLAFGCAKSDLKVTGTWANVRAPETIEFKKDKTGHFAVKDRPSLPFKWDAAEGDRVKIDVNFMGTTRTMYGKIDDGMLVVESAGQKETYQKVR